MKIINIAAIRFPTEKAHGYAIAKQCEAWQLNRLSCMLVVPDRKIPHYSDFLRNQEWKEFYSVTKEFPVVKLPALDYLNHNAYLPKPFHVLTFWLLLVSFQISLIPYLIKKNKDVVYTREISLIPLLILLRKKVFVELHDWPSSKLLGKIRAGFLKRVNGIVVINETIREEVECYGIPMESCIVLPSGVDDEFFKEHDQEKARALFALPNNKIIVLYTGTISPKKGVDVLFKAANVLDKKKDIVFVVAGRWAKGYKPEIPDNVLSLGIVMWYQIPKLLASADIVVVPNKKDINRIFSRYTSPLKLYEAMAAEKPVIVSDSECFKTVIAKKIVIDFEANNPESLAQRIEMLYSHKEKRQESGAKGNKYVKNFTWRKRAEKLTKFIKKNS